MFGTGVKEGLCGSPSWPNSHNLRTRTNFTTLIHLVELGVPWTWFGLKDGFEAYCVGDFRQGHDYWLVSIGIGGLCLYKREEGMP